jgi:hypothetical protein
MEARELTQAVGQRLELIEVEVQHSEAHELTQAVWQRRYRIASEVQLLRTPAEVIKDVTECSALQESPRRVLSICS